MSRSRKGAKAPGWEYWSRRPMSGCAPSPENKKICHGIERSQAKAEVRNGIRESDGEQQ